MGFYKSPSMFFLSSMSSNLLGVLERGFEAVSSPMCFIDVPSNGRILPKPPSGTRLPSTTAPERAERGAPPAAVPRRRR